jgi:hypothetical protein
MNEKRCERPVRSKGIEYAVRARRQRIRRKREYYRNFDKKKTFIVLASDKRREGQLKEKKSWKIQRKTRGL